MLCHIELFLESTCGLLSAFLFDFAEGLHFYQSAILIPEGAAEEGSHSAKRAKLS
jgi:hypothetical protein